MAKAKPESARQWLNARNSLAQSRYQDLAQNECRLAESIMREIPGMTRPAALREAARILAKRESV